LVFCVAVHATVTDRAARIAEELAEKALRETYGLDAVSLSVRTEQYAPGTDPERFWVTVSSRPKPCDGSGAEEIGEIHVQFVRNELHSVQWLPARDPKVRAAAATRMRMLQWARETWALDELVSERSVPSTIPTQHLVFSRRGGKETITIVIDREYGFVHRAYVSPE
jgi:hypothetical protein